MRDDAFSRLEDQLQRLVEGGLSRLLASRLHPQDLANQLVRAMEDQALPGIGRGRSAPDRFVVHLPAEEYRIFEQMQPELGERLAEEILRHARAHDLLLGQRPVITLMNGEAGLNHLLIEAAFSRASDDSTDSMEPISLEAQDVPTASLIVFGRAIPIGKALFQIGRHRSNDLILDDPRVSRFHAQIRLREGRFVLIDVGSRSGMSVNEERMREALLRSGDVIGMGSARLVYIEAEDTPTAAASPARPDFPS